MRFPELCVYGIFISIFHQQELTIDSAYGIIYAEKPGSWKTMRAFR